MKYSFRNFLKVNWTSAMVVLLGAHHPDQEVLDALSQNGNLTVLEAFKTRGVLQNLSGIQLVILGDFIPAWCKYPFTPG